MEDYKIIMKELLLQYYDPVPEGEPKQMQTFEVLRFLRGIIPNEPIGEHDMYDVLKECGFQISQKILTEKVCIYEGDGTKDDPAEYDNVETGRILVWNLYEKI